MKKDTPTSVIQFGLGPIGIEILRRAYLSEKISVLGAVDIDLEKAGKDIGVLLGKEEAGMEVAARVQELSLGAEEETKRVAIHATGSSLHRVWPQIRELLDEGFSVVSTCEELSYPWHRHPELSNEIDAYAKGMGLSVLGTGVNPGFVIDTLPLCLTAVTNEVLRVAVSRRVDISERRLPLQEKVGIGLDKETFERLAAEGEVGHVGLEESARLLAYGLNWEFVEVSNTIEPTISEESSSVELTSLEKGDVDGLHQTSVGKTEDGKEVKLDLTMRVGVEPRDEIVVEGEEHRRLIIPNGVFGDTATAAMAVNCAKMLVSAAAGLLTMADVGLPRNL
jgi:hypothetical protein